MLWIYYVRAINVTFIRARIDEKFEVALIGFDFDKWNTVKVLVHGIN